MKAFLFLLMLYTCFSVKAQSLPQISEPQTNVLYHFYPNLVQLKLADDDYNDYIFVNEACEISLYDKTNTRLASNNFIIKIPWKVMKDTIHFQLFNRADMEKELAVVSFSIINPPIPIIYVDGVMEGGKCAKRPLKVEAKTPPEAPIKLSHEINYWVMEIGDKEVFGGNGNFDEYAYSVLNEFPSGTEIKFRCQITDEREFSSYHEAKFYLK